MNERGAVITKRMQDGGSKTLAFFRAIPSDRWNTPVYTDGMVWTVRQILCHLLDAERELRRVVADVLAGGTGAPEGIDINAHNARAVSQMDHWEPEALLAAFGEARQATIATFEQAQDADFDRVGRHPVLGVRPLDELIKVMHLHTKMHQRDIQQALDQALGATQESLFMSMRKTAIVNLLDQTRQQLKAVLDRLQPGDWETPVQEADQKWTVRQIVSHLVDAQRGMTVQITRINAGEATVPPDFDLNRWNKRSVEKAADKQPPELLTALDEGRTALKQVLDGLSDSDLDKRGRHSSLQIMSIEEIARLIGTHEADHTKIIADRLGL